MAEVFYHRLPFCGCWFIAPNGLSKQYLPQLQLVSHTTVLATTSKTTLQQTFQNPLGDSVDQVTYTFPLYDGVSIAGFKCSIDDRVIVGVVKERNQARTDYQNAVNRGETAGLLEQHTNAGDVFTTSIGNIPARGNVLVEITYFGELKNDAETGGARFTIPTQIAPRYGAMSPQHNARLPANPSKGISITVDVALEKGAIIRGIQSPSHPIAVTMGKTSSQSHDDDSFETNLGSSELALGSTELDKDFVVVISAKNQDTPRALLETHPTIPHQRALMTTLVPKFNIPNDNPEIVFVVDRSGSMGDKMQLVIEALKIFLKSLPASVKFNICSFGSRHSFLFDRSRTYDATSLEIATNHIDPNTFESNYGGTEMLPAVQAVLKRRYKDLPLEVLLLTDGEIWNQDALFNVVSGASKQNARFFTLGIGSQASSSLVEGIARCGRGFAQWVHDGERIDKRIVRMLKGALSPHIAYQLEVKYVETETSDDEYELVESFEKSLKMVADEGFTASTTVPTKPRKISLFSNTAKDEPPNPDSGRYDHLPVLSVPNVLQTPNELPDLYPHNRTTVYLLLGPDTRGKILQSVTLRGASSHGDLELEIPVQDIGLGETIHQLAAKKAMQELEEGKGWLTKLTSANGKNLKSQYEGRWDLIVEREAVRLGTTFQVAGKFCSFVAVAQHEKGEVSDAQTTLGPPPTEYQQGIMLLEQQNRRRFMMRPQQQQQKHHHFVASAVSAAPPLYASPDRIMMSGVTQNACASIELSKSAGYLGAKKSKESNLNPFGAGIGRGGDSKGSSQAHRPASSPFALFGSSSQEHDSNSSSFAFGAPGGAPAASKPAAPKPAAPKPAASISSALVGLASAPLFFGSAYKKSEAPGQLPATGAIQKSAPNRCSSRRDDSSSLGIDRTDARDYGMMSGTDIALENMQRLISLQSFTGTWTVTSGNYDVNLFLSLIAHNAVKDIQLKSVSDIREAVIQQAAGSTSHVDIVKDFTADDCATVLAIAWLEEVMADESDVWEMVVDKARMYLEGRVRGGKREVVEELVRRARRFWEA